MKKPSLVVLSLIAIAAIALIVSVSVGFSIRSKSTARLPAVPTSDLPSAAGNVGRILEADEPHPAPVSGPENDSVSSFPASGGKARTGSAPVASFQPSLPIIRHAEAPVAGRTEMVPGHFDGVMVSHVPLSEPPPKVPVGIPRTPPTVFHPPADKGGGTLYLLDSTWDIPVQAPHVTSPEKVVTPVSPTHTR